MNSRELSEKFMEGIEKALLNLVEKKATLGQSLVTADSEGTIKITPAKKLVKKTKVKSTISGNNK